MKVSMIVLVLSLLSYGITLTMSSKSLSRANCDQKCVNVIIPCPFGVGGSNRSAHASFTIKYKARLKIVFIIVGISLGALILLLIAWGSTKAIRRKNKANRRHKFFKRNGGLLLEQQLFATDNGIDKTGLYNSKELTLATYHYNKNCILRHGSQGTVYQGMLKDGKIVAVKKPMKIDEGDLEVFINEVVILSQVNHMNVVNLLGD